jgi:hypothetical protein
MWSCPPEPDTGLVAMALNELSWGEHSQAAMGVDLVVILDPAGQLLEDGQGVGTGLDAGVVALEGFPERLADAVALWAAHGGEAGDQAKSDVEHIAGEGGAVVSPLLHGGGARRALERDSTIMSRPVWRSMPPVLACQAMISRSWGAGEGPADDLAGPGRAVAAAAERLPALACGT